jgi:homeobox protein EMX
MPLAPASTELPAAHRPKIGFSIDSIVGGGGSKSHLSRSRSNSLTPPSPEPSSTEISAKTGSPRESTFHNNLHNHLHHHHLLSNNSSSANNNHRPTSNGSAGSASPPARHISSSRENSISISNNSSTNGINRSASVNSNTSASTTPPIQSKSPIVFPPSHLLQNEMHHPSPQGHPHGLPPHFAAYPPGMLNFAMAAAAAQNHQSHMPPWMQPPQHHHPHHPGASAHPLYPWLLAKHSRLFPHRFGPGKDLFHFYSFLFILASTKKIKIIACNKIGGWNLIQNS